MSIDKIEYYCLNFKRNDIKLSENTTAKLVSVATKLKNAPYTNIVLQGYSPINGKQYLYFKRLEIIKKYLVEKEGISAHRISTNCTINGGNINVVDIINKEIND